MDQEIPLNKLKIGVFHLSWWDMRAGGIQAPGFLPPCGSFRNGRHR